MFQQLSEKFANVVDRLKGRGKITEANVEEALRQIERALNARRTNRVDESNLRPSPNVRAVRWEFTRGRMAMSRTLRTAQHRAAHLWAMVTAGWRPAHYGAAGAWIAAMPGVNASRLARQSAAVLVLAGVLAVVTVRFDDPRLGFRNSRGDGLPGVINSTRLTSGATPAVVPTAQSRAVLASTMQTAESASQAVVVGPLSRQAVIPDPRGQAAPDDVGQIQDAAPTQFVGVLEVSSNPAGASVFGNGRLLGVTPLRVSKQRAGSLALQITREGYQRWSTSIQVRADQLTRVAATLRPADF